MAGNIIGIIAQRLVRTLCQNCKETYDPSTEERRILGLKPAESTKIYRNVGCKRCNYSGYKGRIALMEILRINNKLDSLIARRAHMDELKEIAITQGFVTLAEDGIRRVIEGYTSIEEIGRVVDLTGKLT